MTVLHNLIHSLFICYLEDFNIELVINKSNLMIWDLALAESICNNDVEKSIRTFLISMVAWT